MSKRQLPPDRVSSYFRAESGVLAVITVTGLLYNIGLVAGPWFEGQMTEALARILLGENSFSVMASLAAGYIAVIAAVQGLRFLKRFYVRRFANKVNRRMKRVLYGALVRSDREDLEREGAGTVLTKAISDVDDCAEGMRKFTTEVFDTGVALAAYAGMLLWYDWRLALLSMAFLPGSYALAERMKRPVQRTGAAFKEQAGALNAATMDRAVNALTYRVFGREEERRAAYEEHLTAYEHGLAVFDSRNLKKGFPVFVQRKFPLSAAYTTLRRWNVFLSSCWWLPGLGWNFYLFYRLCLFSISSIIQG